MVYKFVISTGAQRSGATVCFVKSERDGLVVEKTRDRYRGVFDGRRVLFLNPEDMRERNLKAGQIVDISSHFEGEVRKAPSFAIVPYRIARRSAAAYYPETNVLITIRSVAAKSNQPAAKCTRITLTPAASGEALHFSQASLDHNLHRAAPRVP